MKVKPSLLFLFFTLTIISCKKESNPSSDEYGINKTGEMLSSQSLPAPLTVETIAGSKGRLENRYALRDGIGTEARFNSPQGLDLLPDGTIYVADQLNKKVRKISAGNIVSTVQIPVDPQYEFGIPRSVKAGKDGTLYILMNKADYPREFWIVKPNGQLILPTYRARLYNYSEIVRDPYNDYFWLCGGKPIRTEGFSADFNGLLDKLIVNDQGVIGKDPYVVPQSALPPEELSSNYVGAMVIGHNKVKYIAIGKGLYKLTPSGVFTRIYRNYFPYSIYRLIANKDCQTLYITLENGAIYALTDGKARYLIGPNGTNSGSDGVGRGADVYAFDMALSKDENSIYFTDPINSSVRKLYLK